MTGKLKKKEREEANKQEYSGFLWFSFVLNKHRYYVHNFDSITAQSVLSTSTNSETQRSTYLTSIL